MKMTLKTGSGLLAMAFALVAASPAAAEEAPIVPPENSAVNQYTEAFPTAGGDKDAHEHNGGNPSPKKVLGANNAKKLREQGPAGHATAELAAETAPTVEVEDTVVTVDETDETSAVVPNRGNNGGGGGPSSDRGQTTKDTRGVSTAPPVVEVDGSSGLSEVLSRATGSSSTGGMGIFLPLLIIATIIWAFAYLARQRRPVS